MKVITKDIGESIQDIDDVRIKSRAIFVNSKDEILVANYGGVYLLPGGSIDDGEDKYSAIVRELMEETGLEINKLDLFLKLKYFQNGYPTRSGNVINRLVLTDYYVGYEKDAIKGNKKLTEKENKDSFELRYYNILELEDILRKNKSDNPRIEYFNEELMEVIDSYKKYKLLKENSMFQRYLEILGIDDIPYELIKYLNVPSLVRLKNVGYFCGMDYASRDVYDFSEYISRYDHSLTVALLTWRLTKDLKTTLVGLFHDISTPCFSHVIDYMNKDYEKQESTEEKTYEVIMDDKVLLEYLNNDNIDVMDIVNFKKYSIVDMDRPMMCTDRLDGIILTGLYWTKSINLDDVINIINNTELFKNEDGLLEIGFSCEEVCKLVKDTNDLIADYCSSLSDMYMMDLLSKITKRAIDIGLITYDELFILNELEVMDKLDNSNDDFICDNLYLFKNIKVNDIPVMDKPKIKKRILNPIFNHKRFND